MKKTAGHDRVAAVRALHEALASDNSLTRCQAARALGRIGVGDRATAKRLVALLLDPDADVRAEAAQALGRLKVARAVIGLVNNLKHDPEGEVRIQAATVLGEIGAPAAVEPLIDCLRNDGYPQLDAPGDELEFGASWEVQSRCLDALGKIGDARAADAVIALLANDDYEHLQESGYRVLARLDGERAKSFLLERLRHGGRLARRRAARTLGELPLHGRKRQSQELVAGLLAALADTDPDVRISAARALGRLRHPAAVAPLTRLLRDGDREVREAAAAVLGSWRGRWIARPLHALLAEADLKLRCAVVAVLGEIADPASVGPLSELLAGTDDNLLYATIRAIESIGAPGPEATLAAILADTSNDARLRIAAADALGCLLAGGRRSKTRNDALSVIERAVHDRNKDVAFAALNALVRIEPGRAPTRLLALLRDASPGNAGTAVTHDLAAAAPHAMTAAEVARAFGYAPGADAANATLTAIAADADTIAAGEPAGTTAGGRPARPDLRCFAARLLGGLARPGPEAVRALQAAFDKGDTDLRREVLFALGRLGTASALPTILRGLAAAEPEIRLTAIDALGRLNTTRGTGAETRRDAYETAVARLVHDSDPAVRERAVQVLDARRHDQLPAEHWQRLLEDKHPAVCRAALAALAHTKADPRTAALVTDTMFRHSGELRLEAAAVLRRIDGAAGTRMLLAKLEAPGHEEVHWICLDALAELHARQPAHTDKR